jgi:uncharacterized YigZ family protein
MSIDEYYTIAKPETTEIKIKSSKFISSAFPVNSKENALLKLNEIKTNYFDATHNCFAYQLWQDDLSKASDDGEPSGTAGKPILSAIKKYALNDIIVIVTRYFGGTKLGTGGLIRAYSEATETLLQLCEKKIINITKAIRINCRYEEISLVKRIINEFAISFKEEYTDAIEIIADIPSSKTELFIDTITSTTNLKANAEVMNNK